MPTVNYFRVIDCEHNAANRKKTYKKDHQNVKRKIYKGLLIYESIKVNLQRWQIALPLMSPLEVHEAIEQQQNKKTPTHLLQINKVFQPIILPLQQ